MKKLLTTLALAFAAAAHAQPAPSPSVPVPNADGEVRKVDREQAKVTIKHGPIPNLDMPPMSMVFRVSSPKLLEGLKAGDKVRFAADNVNGALTVTAIEVAK